MSLAIQLPPRQDQMEFNLRVWERLLADPELAKIAGRFETDRHGHIIMSPPPGSFHSSRQSRIAILLDRLLGGRALTECPLSTSDGVKSADVAWFSEIRYARAFDPRCFLEAGEICVKVILPSNTKAEMEEKMALYFDSGAIEVWFCDESGDMRFIGKEGPLEGSLLCPDFPVFIEA
ncbi:Uma2 family endonuclease [Luteolibacter arcticus]|uniref:Uma2 family endonuclease n=1 Tax=Luteolibacter arcticus TaxID=1581411 RepID=A0ABT3GJD4_9BACT|nr:Uma2 family endonuclease [Luteolibacter arcticus]MCW1923629.1 Uma2 family endonuclease [Luteolibacter arcticus]